MGLTSPKKKQPQPPPKSAISVFMESVLDKSLKLATKAQLIPDLLRKANRAAYVLHEIGKGNQKAAVHAETASKELRSVLEELGVEIDWEA